jgi:hypothetical protein
MECKRSGGGTTGEFNTERTGRWAELPQLCRDLDQFPFLNRHHDIADIPKPIRQTRSHGGRHPQRRINPTRSASAEIPGARAVCLGVVGGEQFGTDFSWLLGHPCWMVSKSLTEIRDRANRTEAYRAKAQEVSAIAETIKDPAAKKILLRIADDYLHMAEMVEQIRPRGNGTV